MCNKNTSEIDTLIAEMEVANAKRMIRCEYLCVYCQKSTILEHEHDKDLHIYKDMVCLECQE